MNNGIQKPGNLWADYGNAATARSIVGTLLRFSEGDSLSGKGLISNRPLTPEEIAQLMGPTLAKLLAGKVTQTNLVGFLAAVKSNYEVLGHVPDEYQSACNAPFPTEVIGLIGEIFDSKARWFKEYNAAQTETARKKVAKWQAQADAVWLKHPNFSRTAVAKHIAPDNWNYVRQRISRPKK